MPRYIIRLVEFKTVGGRFVFDFNGSPKIIVPPGWLFSIEGMCTNEVGTFIYKCV